MVNFELPNDETEFIAMMEKVDCYLREVGVPPQARPIQGWLYISRTLKLGLRMSPEQAREPIPGCYTGDDLTIRIFNWFDLRYGKKLEINYGPGRVFILIRHDPWVVNFPKIYGSVHFFISPTEQSSQPEADLKKKIIPRFNILDSIEDLPDGMKAALDRWELHQILERFLMGYETMTALEAIRGLPMMKEVLSDIEASVHHVLNRSPHFGQSKWCSLQATEKLLKAYLATKGTNYPLTHNLRQLSQLVVDTGFPGFDTGWINSIQCSPEIRYGKESSTLRQAWEAHWATITVCGHVAKALNVTTRGGKLI